MKHVASLNDLTLDLVKEDIFDFEGAYMDAVSSIEEGKDREGYFHPSACGSCPRKIVLEYTRTPGLTAAQVYALNHQADLSTAGKAEKQARGQSFAHIPDLVQDRDNLDFGHATHGLLQSRLLLIKALLESKGYTVEVEVEAKHNPRTDELRKEYGLGGTADAIFVITAPNGATQRCVIEIKSIKDRLFQELEGPKPDHVGQAHIYAYRFDCPIIYIWYFNKNNADRRVYGMFFDPLIFEKTVEVFQKAKVHADAGTLPPYPDPRDVSKWICERCTYRSKCNPPVLQAKAGRAAIARARARGFGRAI